jgi:hypothetical protein
MYKSFIINTLCSSMCPMCLCVSKKRLVSLLVTIMFKRNYFHFNTVYTFSIKKPKNTEGPPSKITILISRKKQKNNGFTTS